MRRRFAVLLAGLLATACAAPETRPLTGLAGGPTAAPAGLHSSYVGVLVGALPVSGTVGSGVALDERHVLTNAHVVRHDASGLRLRRADGTVVPAQVVARSPRMDLAVLRVSSPGFLQPARFQSLRPATGEPVWAAGTTIAGPATAGGRVREPEARLAGYGTGLSADVAAVQGFSGGPLVNAGGEVLGLITAQRTIRPSGQFGLSSGLPGGIGVTRDIFVLGIREAIAEARVLLDAVP